jgi:hypothetical protein
MSKAPRRRELRLADVVLRIDQRADVPHVARRIDRHEAADVEARIPGHVDLGLDAVELRRQEGVADLGVVEERVDLVLEGLGEATVIGRPEAQ